MSIPRSLEAEARSARRERQRERRKNADAGTSVAFANTGSALFLIHVASYGGYGDGEDGDIVGT
jgi:hypothetical protein